MRNAKSKIELTDFLHKWGDSRIGFRSPFPLVRRLRYSFIRGFILPVLIALFIYILPASSANEPSVVVIVNEHDLHVNTPNLIDGCIWAAAQQKKMRSTEARLRDIPLYRCTFLIS